MLDPTQDRTHSQLPRLFKLLQAPDFVKNASVDGYDGLSIQAYAGLSNTFPVHTKEATWLSIAYYLDGREQVRPEIAAHIGLRLQKAAKLHGVDFETMEQRYKKSTAQVEPPYALVVEHEGRELKFCPLPDLQLVKTAALHLHQYRDRYPYAWRIKMAQTILRRAQELGIDILPHQVYLEKAAGLGLCTPSQIARGLMERAYLVQDPEVKELLKKYAGEQFSTPFDMEYNRKRAELLAQVDEAYGLNRHYGKGLQTPEEVTFGLLLKEARRTLNACAKLQNNKMLTEDQLQRSDLVKLARVFGPDFFQQAMADTISIEASGFMKAAQHLKSDEADVLSALVPRRSKSLSKWGFLTGE